MFRALSTRRASYGYDRISDEPCSNESGSLLEPQLSRARSVPAKLFGFPRKSVRESTTLPQSETPTKSSKLFGFPRKSVRESTTLPPSETPTKSSKKGKAKTKAKSHPVFSLFGKRMTSKPEFSRYMEYMKEGGRWDKETNKPVVYYKN